MTRIVMESYLMSKIWVTVIVPHIFILCTLQFIVSAVPTLSCEEAQNLTRLCVKQEVKFFVSKVQQFRGNKSERSDQTLSEKACALCRQFNQSSSCLDLAVDYCSYEESQTFLSNNTSLYLGTIADFCSHTNYIELVVENIPCFNGITVNSRKCFKSINMNTTCSEIRLGYQCSTAMADTYCAMQYQSNKELRRLAHLYLRLVEPLIDMNMCSHDSSLPLNQIYPEYKYLWKKPEDHVSEPSILNSNKFRAQGYFNSSRRHRLDHSLTVFFMAVFMILHTSLSYFW